MKGTDRPPVRVLYIAGTGRSGSTLLDRMLGQQPGMFSAGEVGSLWEHGLLENRLCGCGEPFQACAFWTAVLTDAFGASHALDARRMADFARSIDRTRHLLWRFLPGGTGLRDYSEYAEIVSMLYRAIQRVSGCDVIIDSTKNAPLGLTLAGLPGFEVSVVHLVRDSRAVAFSWLRHVKDPSVHWTEQEMERKSLFSASRFWVTQNITAEVLSRRARESTRVRYEDFVRDPRRVLTKVAAWYPQVKHAFESPDDSSVELRPTHTVAGNPMRFQSGPVTVRVDDEWVRSMRRRDLVAITALTFPLLKAYGYPLRP